MIGYAKQSQHVNRDTEHICREWLSLQTEGTVFGNDEMAVPAVRLHSAGPTATRHLEDSL